MDDRDSAEESNKCEPTLKKKTLLVIYCNNNIEETNERLLYIEFNRFVEDVRIFGRQNAIPKLICVNI